MGRIINLSSYVVDLGLKCPENTNLQKIYNFFVHGIPRAVNWETGDGSFPAERIPLTEYY